MPENANMSTLASAVQLSQRAFSSAVRGYEFPAVYLNAAKNASEQVAALRPSGCDAATDLDNSTSCSAWRTATREVERTLGFFTGLRSLGRREITCEGHADLTSWEQDNLTGAMMNPATNQASLEAAFREIFIALQTCAPGGNRRGRKLPGPFFPTSGTLIALMRYGELVGTLPGQRLDFVDNDLDWFIMIPGSEPEAWETLFIPCIHSALGAPMFNNDGHLFHHQPQEKLPLVSRSGADWDCRDATADRPLSSRGMPEVPPKDAALLSSDYFQCRRVPPADMIVDLMEQIVVVDLVRLLVMPGDGQAGEVLGGWDRGGRIPLNFFFPVARCRMKDLTVPCPGKSLHFLQLREGYGNFDCCALPLVTADRCSYHPENLRLLRSGLSQDDVRALYNTAMELNQSGFQSFLSEHSRSGCVRHQLSPQGQAKQTTDGRLRSSVYSSNRETELGGEPLRMFFWRFCMLSRLAVARLLFTPTRSLSTPFKTSNWVQDSDVLGVQPVLAQRMETLLKQGMQLILGLRGHAVEPGDVNSTWHISEMQLARPLEVCAALLLAHILRTDQLENNALLQISPHCDLDRGPRAYALAREAWAPILTLLQKIARGDRKSVV